MTLIRNKAGMGLMLAMAGLVLSALFATASAQTPPFTAYGTTGLEEGQVVEVFVDGESCGTATVNADGEWGPILVGTDDCTASAGDEITFTVDGEAATAEGAPIEFLAGGAPADPAVGIVLSVDDEDEPPAPDPSDTGNAGLLATSGSSTMAVMMLLGVLGAALVAGARVATRRS